MRTALILLAVFAVLLVGCGDQPAQPAAVSPTAAALLPSPATAPNPAPAPAPVPIPTATRPAATATAIPLATADPASFSYLWPAYLPDGMTPSPAESRVAGDDEVGQNAPGFYLVTFNADGGKRKIIVGGGAVEPFQLRGVGRELELDGRKATLVSSGDQRLITFVTQPGQGSLFVLGVGIEEQDLLLAAESLLPIDVTEMRLRVGLS